MKTSRRVACNSRFTTPGYFLKETMPLINVRLNVIIVYFFLYFISINSVLEIKTTFSNHQPR